MLNKQIDIEEKIRPKKNRIKFFKLLDEDIKNLVNPYKNDHIKVNCPACGNKNSKIAFEKDNFFFYSCPGCETLYVNPRPSKKILDHFYLHSKAMSSFMQTLIKNEECRKKDIFSDRCKLIVEILKQSGKVKGRLLEVGCSIGSLLEILKSESSFEVEGLEPTPKAVKIAKKKDIKVHQSTLEDFPPAKKKYDIVLNFETIEHIFDPLYFLIKINQLLKDNGFLIFSTPNYHGFDMMLLGKYYKNIKAPVHLNYFNVNSIDTLLERANFKVIKKMTPGILDVSLIRNQVEDGIAPELPLAIKCIIFNKNIEVQKNFQKFLQNNNLSGNMLIFAQKKYS